MKYLLGSFLRTSLYTDTFSLMDYIVMEELGPHSPMTTMCKFSITYKVLWGNNVRNIGLLSLLLVIMGSCIPVHLSSNANSITQNDF